MRRVGSIALLVLACGCAGPSRSSPSLPTPAEPVAAPREEVPGPTVTPSVTKQGELSTGIPRACATSSSSGSDLCVPDAAFVKRLCNGAFPDVALAILGRDTPFSRIYMKGDVDAWNAEVASVRARLLFDEEMLVLKRKTAPANGILVGAGTGYLVLRWDGNCYTLEDGELTAKKPPQPKHGPIPWRQLADATRDALLKRANVLAAYRRRGKECKGAMSGVVTVACERADTALSAAVVAEIRAGMVLPTPDRVP